MLIEEDTAAGPARDRWRGAEAVVSALCALGVDTVFGCLHETVQALYEALQHAPGIRVVLLRQEQAAVLAAQGYARASGRIGVVFAGAGAGAGGLVTGLLDALCDSVPMLCLTGQLASTGIGKDADAECDSLGITRPVTKWSRRVERADEVAASLRKACQAATWGRPGPVLLEFPVDVLEGPVRPFQGPMAREHGRVGRTCMPPRRRVRLAVDTLLSAQRPVVLAGGGLAQAGPAAVRALREIVERLGLPCATTMRALGSFPSSHPCSLGMAGLLGTLQANQALRHADLLLCVGTRLDSKAVGQGDGLHPDARVIHVDADPVAINQAIRSEWSMVADASALLPELLSQIEGAVSAPRALASWWSLIHHWRAYAEALASPAEDPWPGLAAALNHGEAVVVAEPGRLLAWAARHLRFEATGRWVASCGMALRGHALPAALGAQAAASGRPVVCLTESEAALLHLPEWRSAVEQRLPVKLLLCDFAGPGHRTDCVALAQLMGLKARRWARGPQAEATLAQALLEPGPFVLHLDLAAAAPVPAPVEALESQH